MTLPLWHIVFCFVPLLTVEIILLIRCKKDFALLLQGAVLLGLLALIPATLIQTMALKLPLFSRHLQSSLFVFLISSLLINGFIEEASKAGCLFFLSPKKISFAHFLLLALVAGLSFGSFETVIYMINGSKNLFVRFFTAEILHAACSVCSAVTVYNIKTKQPPKIFWFVLACVFHGFYNFFYVLGSGFIVCAVFCLASSIIYAYKAFAESKKDG
ncbi:MAG: PrsW family intramembrane metalloprotease [Spirochaetaceae bacterium]|nr:PrsW family intramembrane metalloprotease [Spirochaetaceae bacterium]